METKFVSQSNSATPSPCADQGHCDRDDASLIADAKAGSLDAFDQLVRRYEARVRRLAQTIAHNHEDAEEITQNAFLQAFKYLSYFRGDSRFYTWLTRITINAGLMQLRRRRFNEISIDDSVETEEGNCVLELEDGGPNPEQDCSQRELHGILATTISKLDTEYRTVFHLRDVWGFSTQETAHALDLSQSAVKTRLRRARLQLRRSLSMRFNPKGSSPARGRRTISIAGTVLLVLLGVLSARPVLAQDAANATAPPSSDFSFSSRQYLFGNWGGERSRLAEHGVTFDLFYIADLLANPSGGERQRNTGWGRIRGTMDVDLGKLIGANGLTFHATGVWQFGDNLGANIGTLANPSGLVSAHTTRLDSWWLQQSLFNGKLFVKAGQFAGLDFYGDQQYGASYLIEPLDYAFGNLFTTTYESFNPAATPAAEIRFVPTPNIYVKAAALSGNRDPYEQDPTGFHFKIADTPVFVYEAGYLVDPLNTNGSDAKSYPGTYKFGAAYNGGKFLDPITDKYSPGNYLIYVMANQAVYRASPGSNRGLDLDFGFDWSPDDVNRLNSQLTAGFRYNGLIPGRDHDGLAFAVVYSKISDQFSLAGILLGEPALGAEKAIEVNYAIQATPFFLVQPVFQYYVNVGGNSRLPDAPVLGFRTKVTF